MRIHTLWDRYQSRLRLSLLSGALALVTIGGIFASQQLASPMFAAAKDADLMSRQEAVQRATADADTNFQQLQLADSRKDKVDADLITLSEADRRLGAQRGPRGYGPGQDAKNPIWWVTVSGRFQYKDRSKERRGGPAAVDQNAAVQVFVYDARTRQTLAKILPARP